MPFPQKPGRQSSILFEQSAPSKPVTHSQVNVPIPSLQVPLFLHGELLHSSVSVLQFFPSKPKTTFKNLN